LRHHARPPASLEVTWEDRLSCTSGKKLIEKYSNVPMGFADACLVRMTETLADPFILTTDQDFRVYRRHSRQVVPCATPE